MGKMDKEEIVEEIKEKESTEFLDFLRKIYGNKENISTILDEETLENALREKYGLQDKDSSY